MDDDLSLGSLNGHAVGRILKEAVRRAVVVIRNERTAFEAQPKQHYSGAMDDVVTSADRKAQEVYLRTFSECFPNCGVIAEEEALIVEPKNGCSAYFTVDPLDGTKSFVRRQSHGISTMIALVDKGEVLSAYVGDVSTEEVYGFRPHSRHVHRITRLDAFERLEETQEPADLFQTTALLRRPIDNYAPETRDLIARFRTYEVMGSSIGTWYARLWKREVGALFLTKAFETPWDETPVIGISRKLGYQFLRSATEGWPRYEPQIRTKVVQRDYDAVVVHQDQSQALARQFGPR